MKVGILSDIHDNIWKLKAVTERLAEFQIERVIFCGDFCAPFTLKQLADDFSGPIDVVWGNNDGDKWLLTNLAMTAGNVILHGELAELKLGSQKIGVNHYPNIGRRLAESKAYHLVCYGHDHVAKTEHIGKTLLLNPGEVMGRFGKSSFAIYDLSTSWVEFVEV